MEKKPQTLTFDLDQKTGKKDDLDCLVEAGNMSRISFVRTGPHKLSVSGVEVDFDMFAFNCEDVSDVLEWCLSLADRELSQYWKNSIYIKYYVLKGGILDDPKDQWLHH